MGRAPRHRPPAGRQLPKLEPNVQPLAVGHAELPESGTAELPDSGSPDVPESGTTGVPKFARMQRRDARLRPEQWRALDDLLDRIKATRTDRRERLTDNTLLRIAVDLLLTRAGELAGDTEHALHASLGLPESRSAEAPDSGTSGPDGQ